MTSINYYELVVKNPFNLKKVPQEFQTTEMYISAINKTWQIIPFITNFTPEICNVIIDKYSFQLRLIPSEFRTEDICWKSLRASNYATLPYVPNQTYSMCMEAVQNVSLSLRIINEPTLEMCKLAISQYRENLSYVKDGPNRYEIYKWAISKYPTAFNFIKTITSELCFIAVTAKNDNLFHIPSEFQTLDLIKIACENNNKNFRAIKQLTPDILSYIYEKCGVFSMYYIDKNLLTPEIILHALELDIIEDSHHIDLLRLFPEEL